MLTSKQVLELATQVLRVKLEYLQTHLGRYYHASTINALTHIERLANEVSAFEENTFPLEKIQHLIGASDKMLFEALSLAAEELGGLAKEYENKIQGKGRFSDPAETEELPPFRNLAMKAIHYYEARIIILSALSSVKS